MVNKRVLLVEDEKILAKNIVFFLENEGFELDVEYDGLDGLEAFQQADYDLLLLDWTLPRLNGLDLCREVRKVSNVPIIMITAKGEIMDKVIGLEVGADDYIVKPFHQRELLARMHALLRRHQNQDTQLDMVQYESLLLDRERMTLSSGEQKIHLTTTEFRLIDILLKQPERVYTRDYLFEQVWGDSMHYHDRTVDVNISRLRKKLEEISGKRYLQAIRGTGYRLKTNED